MKINQILVCLFLGLAMTVDVKFMDINDHTIMMQFEENTSDAANTDINIHYAPPIGLIPDGGATFLLPRMIGWGRAMELSMLAERLGAEQAQEWGLVNRLFEDGESLEKGALEVAQRLANGPRSLTLIRKAYWQTWSNSYEQQLELEAQLQNEAGRSEDFREGVSAFLQKRDAEFKGQ